MGSPTPVPSSSQQMCDNRPTYSHPSHNLARLFRLDMEALHDMWQTLEQGEVSGRAQAQGT
jgi:hypothetical protein